MIDNFLFFKNVRDRYFDLNYILHWLIDVFN